jgi:hypothetical protein
MDLVNCNAWIKEAQELHGLPRFARNDNQIRHCEERQRRGNP